MDIVIKYQIILGEASVIAGCCNSIYTTSNSVIVGGEGNTIFSSSNMSGIFGGCGNRVCGYYNTISGGSSNSVESASIFTLLSLVVYVIEFTISPITHL
jgi:hypothetical protein